MKHLYFSHCDGDKAVPKALHKSVADAIAAVKTKLAGGASPRIRDEILNRLTSEGWSGEVRVAADSEMTITSIRDHVGLCLQTGNMARAPYDLLKLQTLYYDGHIRAAIMIVPSRDAAKRLGKGLVDASRLEREMAIFKKAYNVPTIVFSLEA
ncbi:BglII/BstYI family type II restriction endonuclease [Achromobacter xylosoxidans]|uniref:BglII/BstYI family type II restriction endonuclease n=1 Tax=Alcaligenes xylosoxydans xylosoxydans TaxID=85698 RepID=UPI002E1993E0|nr:BglII/BstYI family type II restriction endonuclease [Achromobacter xylosoxidans]MEC6411162.1 BglII/BstYI family type II restriction endonuclease [Achromobacter xylosoxidans]